jgi:hypothetical protein
MKEREGNHAPDSPGAGQPGGHLAMDDPTPWVRLRNELLSQIESGNP